MALPKAHTQQPTNQEREDWLVQVGEYLMADILDAECTKFDLKRPPVKYSISFAPNTRTGSKTMGVCHTRAVSTGGFNEIFISPELSGDDSATVVGVLLHELIHAYLDNEDGHKGRFAKIAKAVGFTTPLTTFRPSDELSELLQSYVDLCGPIPHAALNYSDKKKQRGRHLLVKCTTEGCTFKFRTSRAQIDSMNYCGCLVCGKESLIEADSE